MRSGKMVPTVGGWLGFATNAWLPFEGLKRFAGQHTVRFGTHRRYPLQDWQRFPSVAQLGSRSLFVTLLSEISCDLQMMLLPCCCGLISRSRALHCHAELTRVLTSMDKQERWIAQGSGIVELLKHNKVRLHNLVDHILLNSLDEGLTCGGMSDIWWRDRCTVFFNAAAEIC